MNQAAVAVVVVSMLMRVRQNAMQRIALCLEVYRGRFKFQP
jgi:hypothetical protein